MAGGERRGPEAFGNQGGAGGGEAAPDGAQTRQCTECGVAVPGGGGRADGWADGSGKYFCSPCWHRWISWYAENGKEAPPPPPPSAPQDAAKRARRDQLGSAAAVLKGSALPPRRFIRGVSGAQSGSWWGGCACCGAEDGGGWNAACWKQWSEDGDAATRALEHLEYCDAHCHLDYLLLNKKHGIEWIQKKKMCFRWADGGSCSYGDYCAFAHGPEDLQVRQPLEAGDFEDFAFRYGAGADDADMDDGGGISPLTPSLPGRQREEARPLLRALITNCCEVEAITDTATLLACGERLLQGVVYATYGCHPHNYRDYSDDYERRLLEAFAAAGDKAVAWGECGLDYHKNYWDAAVPEKREQMLEVFARQARLAVARGLPLVVHTRDAEEDTLTVLRATTPKEHPVHIHAFQGSPEMLQQILNTMPGAVIGISFQLLMTWASHIEVLARQIPLERLVLETDAPFLAGEPLAVPRIAARVAELKGDVTAEEVLRMTNINCRRFYRIP